MKLVPFCLCVAVSLVGLFHGEARGQTPLSSAFTYQGQLNLNGVPVNDASCTLRFSLFNAEMGGSQIGGVQTVTGVAVTNGLFTVDEVNAGGEFGPDAFNGDERWLQIAVKCSGDAGYTTLSPRQLITATPYSLYALGAPWDGLFDMPAGFADDIDNDLLASTSCANGQVLKWNTGLNRWICAEDLTGSGIGGSGTTNYLPKFTAATTLGNSVIYETGGNVHIGNTSFGEKLSVLQDFASTNTVEDLLSINRGSTGTVAVGMGSGIIFRNESSNGGYALSGRIASVMENVITETCAAGMLFQTRPAGGIMTDAFYLDPNGNAGIGTTNPEMKLDVHGRINISDIDAAIQFDETSGGSGSDWLVGAFGGDFRIGQGNITTNNRFFIEDGGNVGIGATSPSAHLEVSANGTTGGAAFMVSSNDANNGDLFIVEESGDVGIGTTSPANDLDIHPATGTSWIRVKSDASYAGLIIDKGDASANGYVIYRTGGIEQWFVGQINNNDFAISRAFASADGKFYITQAGNVGIGTTSPSEKLTVRGGNLLIERSDGTDIVELGEGLDYAEGFNVSQKQTKIEAGCVLIIDPDNPGKLALSDKPYDRKVAGIVAGAKNVGSGVRLGAEMFDHDIALAGRVYCNVDATESAVEPGDLLTTSSTPGHAMAVKDYTRAQGAILGKAMEKLEKGKKGQILVLVTLQ